MKIRLMWERVLERRKPSRRERIIRAIKNRPPYVLPTRRQIEKDLKTLEWVEKAVRHAETVTAKTLDCRCDI